MTTTTIKKTHIARIREKNAAQLSDICKLLGWSEEKYCWHQFYEYREMAQEMSVGYTDRYLKKVLYSPLYRGFFNNEWNMRNEQLFIPFAEQWWFDRWAMVEEYRHLHNHFILLDDDNFRDRLSHILILNLHI